MSNLHQETKTKEIKLRPITFPKVEEANDTSASDQKTDQLTELLNQISEAEDRLKQIDQEIKTKRDDIEKEITAARENWQAEKETLIESTKKSAFDLGYQDGQHQGFQAVHKKIDQADQIVEAAREQEKKIVGQSEATILELAVKIANKIVSYEISENNAFVEMVKPAIQEVHHQPSIKIYTSVDDFNLITDHRDQLMTLLDPEIVLSVHPLDTLKQGDCTIKTPYSKLDVSVDHQLAKIKTRLIEVMEEIKREHQ
ncbi:FliH/SctL family protein [Amphibacillus sp. Q70]|uniref:FliH/SctL family protein n=1 Tax=Amphibacillus sp. Q70 TaxID=3453416 RepID=UPI003F831171